MNQKFQDLLREAKWDGWDIAVEPMQDGASAYKVVRKRGSDEIFQFVPKKNDVLTNAQVVTICDEVYNRGDDVLHRCGTYNSLLIISQCDAYMNDSHVFYVIRHDISLQKTMGFYAFYIVGDVVWPIQKRQFVHDIDSLKTASSAVSKDRIVEWIESMKNILVPIDRVAEVVKGLTKAAGNSVVCGQYETRLSYVCEAVGENPSLYDIFHQFVSYGQWEASLRPKKNTIPAARLGHILFFAGHQYAKTCLHAFDDGWLQEILCECSSA